MFKIPRPLIQVCRPLELSVTHACNLACEGCLHYNNYHQTRFLTLDEVDLWYGSWSKHIEPVPLPGRLLTNCFQSPKFHEWKSKNRYASFAPFLNILGGEPTLHKGLGQIIEKARFYWPNAHIRLTCTGIGLHKLPNFDEVLYNNDVVLKITIHSRNPAYLNAYSEPLKLAREWQKHGVKVDWAELHSVGWEWVFKFDDQGVMVPHNEGNPRKSWEACDSKSYQIYENMIWKCPKIGCLPPLKESHPEVLSKDFDRYLDNYKPLTLDSTYVEKVAFFEREEEPVCEMCPTVITYRPRESLKCPLKSGGNENVVPLINLEEIVVEHSHETWKNRPSQSGQTLLAMDHDTYPDELAEHRQQKHQ